MTIQYFKIGTGKFIQYDDATGRARIIIKADLQAEKDDIIARMNATPQPTNAVLLEWAKQHYPWYVDYTAEQAELDRVNALLDAIRAL